ncbi:MAG TPA: cobalamin-binding protein [Pyrinomonadaceae bacterium]
MRNCWEIRRAVYVVLVLIGAVGCRIEPPNARSEQEASTRVVTDDLGRSVRLPQDVERVLSLAPSLTESIYAVGAGDKLVGVTTYCNYPEEARAKEKVGDTQTPNIERIVALKPDIVFVSTASQLEAFMQTLEQQNIAVYVMDAKDVDDAINDLQTLGEILGMTDTADELASALDGRVKEVADRKRQATPPKVFVQISNEPLFTIGRESFVTKLIATAGGESVTKDVPSAYPKLSKETASAMNPEVIILSDSEDNREPNSVFKNSDAVKNGRVYRINADIISRPGPRLVDALEQIAEFLHK